MSPRLLSPKPERASTEQTRPRGAAPAIPPTGGGRAERIGTDALPGGQGRAGRARRFSTVMNHHPAALGGRAVEDYLERHRLCQAAA